MTAGCCSAHFSIQIVQDVNQGIGASHQLASQQVCPLQLVQPDYPLESYSKVHFSDGSKFCPVDSTDHHIQNIYLH